MRQRELLVDEQHRRAVRDGQRGAQRVGRVLRLLAVDDRPGRAQRGADEREHLARRPAALVGVLIQHDGAEVRGDRLRGLRQQVVPAVARQRQRHDRLAAPDVSDEPAGRLQRRGVVTVVDDDGAAASPVDVAPAGVGVFRRERHQSVADVLGADAQRAAGGDRGERVGDDVPGLAAEGAGQLGDAEQRAGAVWIGLGELAVADLVAQPAGLAVPGHDRIRRVEAEEPDRRTVAAHGRPVRERRGGRVVGIQHDAAAVADLLGDERLDVNQLGQVVDPVVAEVVSGDVGDDGDVGAVIAQAAPHDAAPGGLQHGRLDAGIVEHHLGRPRAGRVRRVHSRPPMCTPSVQDTPTRRPLRCSTCPTMRTVVVFPLVPVTDTIGTRARLPGG